MNHKMYRQVSGMASQKLDYFKAILESSSSRYTRTCLGVGTTLLYAEYREYLIGDFTQFLERICWKNGIWVWVRSYLHRFCSQRSQEFTMADNLSRASRPAYVYDAYIGMKLDIDNMTYENLFALGERMGKVCTGIPDRNISMCLALKLCGNHGQKRSCVICLDDYKIKNDVGALKKCGHEYHASCVIMWLLTKKTCPICRSDVLDPTKSDWGISSYILASIVHGKICGSCTLTFRYNSILFYGGMLAISLRVER